MLHAPPTSIRAQSRASTSGCLRPPTRTRSSSLRRAHASLSHSVHVDSSGRCAETVQARSLVQPARSLVLVLPGNPGVASFYSDYAQALRDQLSEHHVDVRVLGLLGHSRDSTLSDGRTWLLDQQVAHCTRYLAALPPGPVLLVGHSIGAHIALQALTSKNPEAVRGVVGLYPFLTLNAQSRTQALLAVLVGLRPLVWLVARLAALVAVLPTAWRLSLLRQPLRALFGLSDEAAQVTADWVRADSVLNTCHLGASEFLALSSPPDWASFRAFGNRVRLYYGPEDDLWAPEQHAAEAARQGLSVVRDGTIGHMFCVTRRGCEHVAAATAAMLRPMLAVAVDDASARAGRTNAV